MASGGNDFNNFPEI